MRLETIKAAISEQELLDKAAGGVRGRAGVAAAASQNKNQKLWPLGGEREMLILTFPASSHIALFHSPSHALMHAYVDTHINTHTHLDTHSTICPSQKHGAVTECSLKIGPRLPRGLNWDALRRTTKTTNKLETRDGRDAGLTCAA